MIQAKEIVKMMIKPKILKYTAFAIAYFLVCLLARYIGIKYHDWIQAHATVVSLSLFIPGTILVLLLQMWMIEKETRTSTKDKDIS